MLFTITPGIERAIARAGEVDRDVFSKLQLPSEPSIQEPKTGNPISHSQLIDLSKLLKQRSSDIMQNEDEESFPYTLEFLLRGSNIFIPPPTPKKEPTPEFKALMARLRAEEEARAYERMTNPISYPETFSQRYPTTQFSVGAGADFSEEDELSYDEVHRQIILIINVIVSIVACSIFIWVAARHWSVGLRLGLSMGGSGAVAIAEVVVYSGYVRKIQEAKRKEKKKPEIKEIVQSWVIDKDTKEKDIALASGSKDKLEDSIRYRKGKHR